MAPKYNVQWKKRCVQKELYFTHCHGTNKKFTTYYKTDYMSEVSIKAYLNRKNFNGLGWMFKETYFFRVASPFEKCERTPPR